MVGPKRPGARADLRTCTDSVGERCLGIQEFCRTLSLPPFLASLISTDFIRSRSRSQRGKVEERVWNWSDKSARRSEEALHSRLWQTRSHRHGLYKMRRTLARRVRHRQQHQKPRNIIPYGHSRSASKAIRTMRAILDFNRRSRRP